MRIDIWKLARNRFWGGNCGENEPKATSGGIFVSSLLPLGQDLAVCSKNLSKMPRIESRLASKDSFSSIFRPLEEELVVWTENSPKSSKNLV